MKRLLTVLALVQLTTGLSLATVAHAAQPTATDSAGVEPPRYTAHGFVEAQLAAGRLAEDTFLSVMLGLALTREHLDLAIEVPLRFRLVDHKPTGGGALRQQDWDEASDFLRVVPLLRYTTDESWLTVQLGAAQGTTFGNGTLVDAYFAAIDIDHYQGSVSATVERDGIHGDLLLDNLIDPNLVALRAAVRPLVLAHGEKRLQGLEVGLTTVMDAVAPWLVHCQQGRPCLNDDRDIVADDRPAFLWGVDVAWAFAVAPHWQLRPYSDINALGDFAGGWHLGMAARWEFAEQSALTVRAEYRLGSGRYAASYVNPLYEVERYSFPRRDYLAPCGPDNLGPKLGVLRQSPAQDVSHGVRVDASVLLFNRLHAQLGFEEGSADRDSALILRLAMPDWYGAGLQFLWVKRSAAGAADLFALDRTLIVAHARYTLFNLVYLYGQWAHQFHVAGARDTRGEYRTVDDWNVGAGADLHF